MPKIPVYEQQVGIKPTVSEVVRPLAPVEAAFGAQVSMANARLAETVGGLSDRITKHMIDKIELDDQKVALQKQVEFLREAQPLLYSTEKDTNGVPVGIMNRQLGQAKNSTVQFDQHAQQLINKYLESLTTNSQKASFYKFAESHYNTARQQVISHEATQGREDNLNVNKAAMDARASFAATINDPATLAASIDEARATQGTFLKKTGVDQGSIEMSNQAIAGKMLTNAFNSVIEKDPRRAQALLDAAKDRVHQDEVNKLQLIVDGKKINDDQVQTWNRVNNVSNRLADGQLDLGKIHEQIFGMKNPDGTEMPTKKKETLFDYAKAQAGEQWANKKRAEAAAEYKFVNWAATAQKEWRNNKPGVTLAEAVKQVPQFGGTQEEQSKRISILQRMFSDEAIFKNPEVINELHKGIINGDRAQKDVDEAFQNKLIDSAEWQNLTNKAFEVKQKGVSLNEKYAWEDAERAIKDAVPKDQIQSAMAAIRAAAVGKNPEEIRGLVRDYTTKVPGSATWWFGPDKKKIELEMKKTSEQGPAVNELYGIAGKDAVMAIGNTPEAFKTYSDALGGPDALKVGTPANNAIKSLNALGKPITPANVKFIVEQFKSSNGIIPPGTKIK